jgi:photosystem II stability/assembly factor-like uncharacterized protein
MRRDQVCGKALPQAVARAYDWNEAWWREKTMAATHVYAGAVCAMNGTVGGIFRHTVGNGGWQRLTNGLPDDAQVHAVTVHTDHIETVFIGTTKGAFRSTNCGDRWERLTLPDREADVWSITIDPTDRRTIYAGVGPIGVYRSDDGGESWKKLPDPRLPDRVHMTFPCRVMRLDVDPTHSDDLYACIEANGTMRSRDRGESWEDCTEDLIHFTEQQKYKSRIVSQTEIEGMLDGHALACSAAAPGSVFLANRMGLFRSDDKGAHWADIEVGRFSPLTYGRDLRVSPHDPKVLYAALSPAFRSSDGGIFRSQDVGRTWARFDHGMKAEATMMGVSAHPRDPNRVYGVTRVGQVFGTNDGGKNWTERRLPDGAGDCYAIACG